MVPIDQVARLRMLLASDGLPHGGSVGYEIFDKSDAFGTSSFVENINQVRALEGELARTISSINLVQSARVHLVLPRREIFTRERQMPSASIVVKLRSAERLASQQVAAIQHLVASAVPDLTADAFRSSTPTAISSPAAAATATRSRRPRPRRCASITRTASRASSRSCSTAPSDPASRASMCMSTWISTASRRIPKATIPTARSCARPRPSPNSNDSSDGSAAQPVSVASALPNAPPAAGTAASSNRTRGSHNEETVNYEITKTVRNQVRETGQVMRQSVAVLVDGTYTTAPDGTHKYEQRSPDDMKQLTALVRSAIGYDEKRGDALDVINLRFAPVDEPASVAPPTMMGFEKADLMHLGETLILAIVAVLVILLVIRPLVNRLLDGAGPGGPRELGRLHGGPSGAPALPAPGGNAMMRSAHLNEAGEMIDMSQVEGRVAQSSLRKVGEIVEKHPEEALAIVRSWMYSESR